MEHVFFIHSSVDRHVGCSHISATVNSDALNTGEVISLQDLDFLSFLSWFSFFLLSHPARSGSDGRSNFNFLMYEVSIFSTSSPTRVISHIILKHIKDMDAWASLTTLRSHHLLNSHALSKMFCLCYLIWSPQKSPGYSPRGRKESDRTEWLFHFHFFKLNVLPVLSHLIFIEIPILQMRK